MPFTEEQTARLKGKLSKKGQELAQMLSDVMAGNVQLKQAITAILLSHPSATESAYS